VHVDPVTQTSFWQLPVQHWAELVHAPLRGRQAHFLLPLGLVTKLNKSAIVQLPPACFKAGE